MFQFIELNKYNQSANYKYNQSANYNDTVQGASVIVLTDRQR